MNSPRYDFTMEVVDGSLMVFGGFGCPESLDKFDGAGWREETVEFYHTGHASVTIPCAQLIV